MAIRAPAPVFVVRGSGVPEGLEMLRLHPEVEIVETPRHANVLLVAGEFTGAGLAALRRVHDQMSVPRVTVRWGGAALDGFPGATVGADGVDDIVRMLVTENAELLRGSRPSEVPILPDVDPAEWRGVGPYGQGGKGMTGGVPYGRPMAERGPDRDGLELDALSVTVGPWLSSIPPGLAMRVVFQGDLIYELSVSEPAVPGFRNGVFWEATRDPASIAELEMARARHHLVWLAEALRLLDLGPLAVRALRLAARLTPDDESAVAALERTVRRTGVFRWSLPAAGRISPELTDGLGPVARSSGRPDDARSGDPGYRSLGFEPVIDQGGDVPARWRQRLAETLQSLRLARRAGEVMAFGSGIVEGPRGRLETGHPTPSATLVGHLPDILAGVEWGDAVSCIASLDIDMAEAATATAEDRFKAPAR